MYPRVSFELDSYVEAIQKRACFICDMVAGRDEENTIIYRGPEGIAFLNKYPSLYGYVIAAPLEHREQVTADFTEDEYVGLQRFVYRVAEAVRAEVEPERVYILSLGSQQGNRHVHWHIAPLPHGVPFKQQQLAALDLRDGYLNLPPDEQVALAERIRHRLTGENGEWLGSVGSQRGHRLAH